MKTEWIRCPLCAASDLKKYGKAYLHLNHFLPDISVCTKHGTKLLDYNYLSEERPFKEPVWLKEERLDLNRIIQGDSVEIKVANTYLELFKKRFDPEINKEVFNRYIQDLFESKNLAVPDMLFIEEITETLKFTLGGKFLEKTVY